MLLRGGEGWSLSVGFVSLGVQGNNVPLCLQCFVLFFYAFGLGECVGWDSNVMFVLSEDFSILVAII